jgi:hypothetical protein
MVISMKRKLEFCQEAHKEAVRTQLASDTVNDDQIVVAMDPVAIYLKAGVRANNGWNIFRHTYRTSSDSTGAPIAIQL